MLGDVAQNAVAALAGTFEVTGLEGKPEALGGRVAFVDGQMAPPDTTVVPQVVVRVSFVHTQG